MKLTQKIQLERIYRTEQLTRAEQAQLLACPEAQALLKENAALVGIEWHGGEAAPSRAVTLARTSALAGIPQEEPKMALITRWFAAKSLPYKIALASSLTLVIVLTAVFIPFEHFSLLNPAWASSDGYMLKIPLDQTGDGSLTTPQDKEAQLDQLLADWRAGYERSVGPLPEGFAQSVQVSTGSGDPEARVAMLNADEEQLKSVEKYLQERTELPEFSMEPRTWFSEDSEMQPFTKDGIEIIINDRVFTFPPGASEAEIKSKIEAWLAETDPELRPNVDVKVEKLEGGSSVTVNISSRGGSKVSASASSSSSSSNSSSSRSAHESSGSSSSHHSGSASGGGGGNASGNAGGGGGGGGNAGGSGSAGGGGNAGGGGSSSAGGADNSGGSSSSHHVEGGGSGSGSKSGSSSGSGSGSGSGSSNSSSGDSSNG